MRVLLADQQSKVRFALATLLQQQSGIVLVDEVTDADGLLAKIKSQAPDLILLDWSLAGRETVDLLVHLRKNQAKLAIIVLSGRPEMRHVALAAGADAFVSKAEAPDQLLAAVQKCQQKLLQAGQLATSSGVQTHG